MRPLILMFLLSASMLTASTVAGVVILVARYGRVAALDSVGYTDLETKQSMKPDNIFQIHYIWNVPLYRPQEDLIGIFLIHREGGSDERQAFVSMAEASVIE